jgi:hypothetical protein
MRSIFKLLGCDRSTVQDNCKEKEMPHIIGHLVLENERKKREIIG